MTKKLASIIVLIPFTILSLYAVYDVGYLGIFTRQFANSGGWQVLTDLVIACVLCLSWLILEAKRDGRNPVPFVIITLVLASFGPLLYLATSKSE